MTLTHFTSETAAEAGRKGAQVRRAKAAARRAEASDLVSAIRTLAGTIERDDLGPMAIALAAYVMGAVLNGTIPVRNGSEAAELVRVLVDVGRMESGDPARTVAVAHLSGPALAERLRALQVTTSTNDIVTSTSSAANTVDDAAL